MNKNITKVEEWYNNSYSDHGFDAQRRYPNEEMLRFLGRNFFRISHQERKNIRVLEVGCGSCSNLWVIAKEGFDAYGIDLSPKSLELGRKMLESWSVSADLKVASMTDMPHPYDSFDIILDVFSSNCLNQKDFSNFLFEIKRVLKSGAKFFSYFPSKASDTFINHSPAQLLDKSTLNGIFRKDSPFYGNHYTFRFMHPKEYKEALNASGFQVDYLETVVRSYRSMCEVFEPVVEEATKK